MPNKSIKTMLDFEEIDDEFNDALLQLDMEGRVLDADAEHGYMKFERWNELKLQEFNQMVCDTAELICSTLVANNFKYNSAYWWARKYCKEKYGDSSIPYNVHILEKNLRSWTPGDNEDAELDKVGYEFLEYVCRKLEKKWDMEAESRDKEYSEKMAGWVDEYLARVEKKVEEKLERERALKMADGVNESLAAEGKPVLPEKPKPGTCYQCGKKLTGEQKKFCCSQCNFDFTKDARRARMKKLEEE